MQIMQYLYCDLMQVWNDVMQSRIHEEQTQNLLLDGYFATRKSHSSDFITDITERSNGRIRTSVSLHLISDSAVSNSNVTRRSIYVRKRVGNPAELGQRLQEVIRS